MRLRNAERHDSDRYRSSTSSRRSVVMLERIAENELASLVRSLLSFTHRHSALAKDLPTYGIAPGLAFDLTVPDENGEPWKFSLDPV